MLGDTYPALQVKHSVDPEAAAYLPAAHSVQLALPAAEYMPGGHMVLAVAPPVAATTPLMAPEAQVIPPLLVWKIMMGPELLAAAAILLKSGETATPAQFRLPGTVVRLFHVPPPLSTSRETHI